MLTPRRSPSPIVGDMTIGQPRRWAWSDLIPALPLLIFVVVGTGQAAHEQIDATRPDLLGYALTVVAPLALLLRRRNPIAGLGIVGAAISLYLLLRYPFGPVLLTAPFAVHALVVRTELRRAVVLCSAFVVITWAASVPLLLDERGAIELLGWSVAWPAVVAAPAAVASAVRARQQSEEGVRAERAQRALSEERLRTTQEVHDAVGHGLAVIAMQAGVALHVLERNPAGARESLEAIRVTSREVLDGLRDELEQLRTPDESAARRPSPGLADVPALVDRMRAAGADVTLQMDDLGTLPVEVDLQGYRIVQESLTNVLRHAATAKTAVTVERAADELVINVVDGGPRNARVVSGFGGGGTGIDGMRARASMLGGTLAAEPTGSGFMVRARLPTNDNWSGER